MRVVIDTGVLVSALIQKHGTPGRVLKYLRDGNFSIIYSKPLQLELVEVLNRPIFRQKYHIQPSDIMALIRLTHLRGELVIPQQTIDACRDPKDYKFLEAALTGQAEVIVSGDEDLLGLNPFRGISIITPAEFVRLFEKKASS
jgi:putative PIN family toxin of toxin-antitoxin system